MRFMDAPTSVTPILIRTCNRDFLRIPSAANLQSIFTGEKTGMESFDCRTIANGQDPEMESHTMFLSLHPHFLADSSTADNDHSCAHFDTLIDEPYSIPVDEVGLSVERKGHWK